MPAPRARREPAIHPFDQLHGTDTSGLLPATVIAEGTHANPVELTAYYGIAPSILRSLITLWLQHVPQQQIEHTVFLDVGAGKGRAMLLASEFPFLRVEGVELNPELAQVAADNIARWHASPHAEPLAPIAVHQADATAFPLPAEHTLVFMFHPFELPILRRFVRHLETSFAAHPNTPGGEPRSLDLLYANSEHAGFFDRHPSFRQLWHGPVAMTPEDHRADLAAIAEQKEYGSTGDEICSIYRYTSRSR
jgi:SAM-dependent methyltransferase